MVTYGYRGVVTLVIYIYIYTSLLYHLALGRDSNCETLSVWDPPLQGNSPLLLSVMNAQEFCCDLCQETYCLYECQMWTSSNLCFEKKAQFKQKHHAWQLLFDVVWERCLRDHSPLGKEAVARYLLNIQADCNVRNQARCRVDTVFVSGLSNETPILPTGWCLSWDPSFNIGWDRLHNWNLAKKSFSRFILYTLYKNANYPPKKEWGNLFWMGLANRKMVAISEALDAAARLKMGPAGGPQLWSSFSQFCAMEKDETDHKRM